LDKSGWLFAAKCIPCALQAPCQALGPSSETAETPKLLNRKTISTYSIGKAMNTSSTGFLKQINFSKSLRQMASRGLLNDESLANLQANRNRLFLVVESVRTPQA